MSYPYAHLQSVQRVLDTLPPGWITTAEIAATVGPMVEATRQARDALPPDAVLDVLEATGQARVGFPYAITDALLLRPVTWPGRLTLADLDRVHRLTSRYATGLSFPATLPNPMVVEQAASLQSLAWWSFAAVAAEPDPEEVFKRADDHDGDVMTILSTLVDELRRQTEQQKQAHMRTVVATRATVCAALVSVLAFFGFERTLRALEALARAL